MCTSAIKAFVLSDTPATADGAPASSGGVCTAALASLRDWWVSPSSSKTRPHSDHNQVKGEKAGEVGSQDSILLAFVIYSFIICYVLFLSLLSTPQESVSDGSSDATDADPPLFFFDAEPDPADSEPTTFFDVDSNIFPFPTNSLLDLSNAQTDTDDSDMECSFYLSDDEEDGDSVGDLAPPFPGLAETGESELIPNTVFPDVYGDNLAYYFSDSDSDDDDDGDDDDDDDPNPCFFFLSDSLHSDDNSDDDGDGNGDYDGDNDGGDGDNDGGDGDNDGVDDDDSNPNPCLFFLSDSPHSDDNFDDDGDGNGDNDVGDDDDSNSNPRFSILSNSLHSDDDDDSDGDGGDNDGDDGGDGDDDGGDGVDDSDGDGDGDNDGGDVSWGLESFQDPHLGCSRRRSRRIKAKLPVKYKF